MRAVKVEQFEGPLDLLYQLIQKNELDIAEVSMAAVTEQYLSCLEEASADLRADELADFLVIASRLLLIKSRGLLPVLTEEEEDDIEDLQARLKIYHEFAEAAKLLGQLWSNELTLHSRSRPPVRTRERVFSFPEGLTADTVQATWQRILSRIEPPVKVRKVSYDRQVNLRHIFEEMCSRLKARSKLSFRESLSEHSSKTEMIVSFLAMLELVKQKHAFLEQSGVQDDIYIRSL